MVRVLAVVVWLGAAAAVAAPKKAAKPAPTRVVAKSGASVTKNNGHAELRNKQGLVTGTATKNPNTGKVDVRDSQGLYKGSYTPKKKK